MDKEDALGLHVSSHGTHFYPVYMTDINPTSPVVPTWNSDPALPLAGHQFSQLVSKPRIALLCAKNVVLLMADPQKQICVERGRNTAGRRVSGKCSGLKNHRGAWLLRNDTPG